MPAPFRFKQFTVNQQRAAMKVGTDGVLLGAWCTITPDMRTALDIGTGTGLIALMTAQRGAALTIDALEPDSGAHLDASENIRNSPWCDRITTHALPVQQYQPAHTYDLIVCNPPWFVDSLTSPQEGRTAARHTRDLTRDDLIASATRLSHPGTRLSIIIPTIQAADYVISADLKGFSLSRRTDVRTTPTREPKRTLLEFVFDPTTLPIPHHDTITIQTAPQEYTEEYRLLTADFYLHF